VHPTAVSVHMRPRRMVSARHPVAPKASKARPMIMVVRGSSNTVNITHTCYELNGREFNGFFASKIRKGWDLADGLWSIEGSTTSPEDEEPQQKPSVGRIRELGVAIVARHAVQSRIDECVAHHVMYIYMHGLRRVKRRCK